MAARKTERKAATAPPPTVEVEPSVRRFVDWTTDLCKQAEVSADSGYLRSAARVCEWVLTDDRVASTLNTRVQALLGLEPTFEASGDKRRSNRAVKALDAGEDWWSSYPEPESALILKWGLVLGLGPGQHQWVESDEKRWLPTPEFWHPYNVSFDLNRRVWKTWVASEGNGSPGREIEISPGDSQWLLHCPFGKNRPWAWGLWHGLWPLVLLKHLARQDWSRSSEKASIMTLTMPFDAAKEYQQQSRQQRQQLSTEIYNRGRNAVAALPPGFDLKLVQTVANTEELFNAQIDMANTAIAVLIRGGNLGTENDGGSRAATESQARTGDLTNLRFDAQSWTTTVHDQSLVWWAKFNYGDPKLAPWPVYPVEPEADLGKKAESDSKAFANVDTAEKLGFDVDRQAFLDEHKLSSWCKPGERPKAPEIVETVGEEIDGEESDDDPEGDRKPAGSEPPAKVRDERSRASGSSEVLLEQAGRSDGTGHRLASGQPIAAGTNGFLSGQLYVDAVAESHATAATKQLKPLLKDIEADINAAESYEDLRAKLHKRFESASPDELNVLVYQAIVLGALAGKLAVIEDT